MPVVNCPFPGCDFTTPDFGEQLVTQLLATHTISHIQAAAPTPAQAPAPQAERVRRPTIIHGGSTEDRTFFLSRWEYYAKATRITGEDRVIQLLECCDEQLRKDVHRTNGASLASKPEAEILQAIKRLAIRHENVIVARMTLHGMRQDRDEPIRTFAARVHGQADVCQLTETCTACQAEVSYKKSVIRDVLTQGMADHDTRLDLIGDRNQNMTLEEVISFIESKETGKRENSRLSGSHTLDTTSTAAVKSQYKKSQAGDQYNSRRPPTQELCIYCGLSGHGSKAPFRIRQAKCKAVGHKCSLCKRDHHFENVCLSNTKPQVKTVEDTVEGTTTHALCSTTMEDPSTSLCSTTANPLKHHVYDKDAGEWQQRPSRAQPYVNVELAAADFREFGQEQPSNPTTTTTRALADTGCQSCLAGIRIIEQLNIERSELITTATAMRAAE